MKMIVTKPPRVFEVGHGIKIPIKDCGRLHLDADEQVTFCTANGAEYDVTRKSWGFYATPSLNHRLKGFGLRAALVKNVNTQFYVLLVERGHEEAFENYLGQEDQKLVCWLDDTKNLQRIERFMEAKAS